MTKEEELQDVNRRLGDKLIQLRAHDPEFKYLLDRSMELEDALENEPNTA